MKPFFPSAEHRKWLSDRICASGSKSGDGFDHVPKADRGYSTLTGQERNEYHSYVYAWRRHYLDNHEPVSPVDPSGTHFHEQMVERAQRALFHHYPKSPERPASETVADPMLRDHYARQDQERLALKADIVGHGRLPGGDYTPELQAFMNCCLRQVQSNTRIAAERWSKPPGHRPVPLTMEQLQEWAGIKATEGEAYDPL